MKEIPTHSLADDMERGVQLRIVPLATRTEYDDSEPHRHNYFELFFFSRGGGTHMIDFEDHSIRERSIHMVRPGQVHVVRRGLDTYGFVVLFVPDLLLSAADSGTSERAEALEDISASVVSASEPHYDLTQQLIAAMQAELRGKNPRYEILRSFLILLIQYFHRSERNRKSPRQDPRYEAWSRFNLLLEKNFKSMHRISAYARQLGMNEKKLSGITKAVCGKGAGEMIQDRLVLEAKRLLSHSSLTMKEISYYLHFEDPSYFVKFFKRNTGLTPGDFQEAFRKKYHY